MTTGDKVARVPPDTERIRRTILGALTVARHRVADPVAATIAAVAASAALVPVLKLWHANLRIPFAYSSDANFNLMIIKGLLDHGSWYANPDLGAPLGQRLHDFAPGTDDLDFVLLRAVGLFSKNPAVVMNLFYLATFPLAALSAYMVLRWIGISRLVSVASAVLYALSPYHFTRGEIHLFLAADFAVPLGAYLVLGAWSGKPLIARRAEQTGPLSFVTWRSAATLGACLVVASAGGDFYYPAITFILLAIAVAGRFLAERSRAELAAGTIVLVVLAAAALANLAPTFAYTHTNGRNYAVANRDASESDVGGLKLTELVFPIAQHRLHAFATFTRRYNWSATPPALNPQERPALGALGTIGFFWLLLVLVLSAARRTSGKLSDVIVRSQPAALAAGTALLVGTVGGIATIVAYLITPQLRAWNRISIFIAFFAIVALGVLLDRVYRAASARRWGRLVFVTVLVALVTGGIADQTSPMYVPRYGQLQQEWRQDENFVAAIEHRVPRGSMIFELPYVPFPEGLSPGRLIDYDLARPYIHSNDLRWSYGAMKSRPEDWEAYLAEKPLREIVAGAAASGFAGVYVDLYAYKPGAQRRRFRAQLHAVLPAKPLVGARGRLLFLPLSGYAAQLRRELSQTELRALRVATLTPPRAQAGRGISPRYDWGGPGQRSYWLVSRHAFLDLYEPAGPETVTFSATFRTGRPLTNPSHRQAGVTVVWPDRRRTVFSATPRGTQIRKRVRLEHGSNLVEISTNADQIRALWDPRTLYLQIENPSFAEQAFAPFVRLRRTPPRHPPRRSSRA